MYQAETIDLSARKKKTHQSKSMVGPVSNVASQERDIETLKQNRYRMSLMVTATEEGGAHLQKFNSGLILAKINIIDWEAYLAHWVLSRMLEI